MDEDVLEEEQKLNEILLHKDFEGKNSSLLDKKKEELMKKLSGMEIEENLYEIDENLPESE